MDKFNRNHIKNIKCIFEEKTGTSLPCRKTVRHPIRTAAILTALIACCFTLSALAVGLFSSLAGDELSLSACYEGEGVFSVLVENKSSQELNFQPVLRLMQWTTGKEIEPLSGNAVFHNTKIPAQSSSVMTIDLSGAYDIEQLEKPLENDWYYFVLTNNHFVFGQDWMCSVTFTDAAEKPASPSELPAVEQDVPLDIVQNLQFYFESDSFDTENRRATDAEYVTAYTTLFNGVNGQIVPSISPILPGNKISTASPRLQADEAPAGVIFDDNVPSDQQHLLIGQNWSARDVNFKLLATQQEHALVLSASLPLQKYEDASRALPLFYVFTYEKSAISSDADYAFIYGQLVRFADLEQYQVYEDAQHVCYEISALIYPDLDTYVQNFVTQNPDLRFNEQVLTRIQNIYAYYKENLCSLLSFK